MDRVRALRATAVQGSTPGSRKQMVLPEASSHPSYRITKQRSHQLERCRACIASQRGPQLRNEQMPLSPVSTGACPRCRVQESRTRATPSHRLAYPSTSLYLLSGKRANIRPADGSLRFAPTRDCFRPCGPPRVQKGADDV